MYFHVLQALNKMEAGRHNMAQCVTMGTEEMIKPASDTETCTGGEEDKPAPKKKEEAKSEEAVNHFPPKREDAASSKDVGREDEAGTADEAASCPPAHDSGAAGPPGEHGCWSAERMLQQSVDRLKTLMETDLGRERRTSGPRSSFTNITGL